MRIYVTWNRDYGEDQFFYDLEPTETFCNLKQCIKDQTMISVDNQKLLYGVPGKFTIDDLDGYTDDWSLNSLLTNNIQLVVETKEDETALNEEDEVDYAEVPRFELDDPAWTEYFKDNGYVVIANVLEESDILTGRTMCHDWLEEMCPGFDRHDVTTWDNDIFPANPTNGICHEMGIGQSDYAWFIRSRPKIKETFSILWENDDLISSFDGCGLFRPWKYKKSWRTKGGWMHIDQSNRTEQGFCCVQGLVNLYDCTEYTGGLTVIPGSHHYHDDICDRNPNHGNYVPIQENDEILELTNHKLVACKAGDLCLWDSRTVHCNTPGIIVDEVETEDRTEPWELIRIAHYVCMVPRSKADETTLESRRQAYLNHYSSFHSPNNFIQLPSTAHAERKMELTDHIAALIGMHEHAGGGM